MEIELERTFLAKYLPEGWEKCEAKEILDIYIPKTAVHPVMRMRKRGLKFEITKKETINGNDSSEQREITIPLTEEEYADLNKISGKRLHKKRYYFPYGNMVAEIDVFLDELAGLVVVDFEFSSRQEMEAFEMPEFCLADVTQEAFIAGGVLAGKRYEDIKKGLEKYGYQKINF